MEKFNLMKERLLTNWTLWRITRFILSLIFIINGVIKVDYILILGGVFLLGHALVNSCATCASGNCEIPQKK
jgi:hypothetical protein